MGFYDMEKEEIEERLHNLYDEYADIAADATAEYNVDTHSASKRTRMHRCSNELRVFERILDEIGLNFSEE